MPVMKYIILLGDGMADYPLAELGGRTPLEAANKPNIDGLARSGFGGRLQTIPDGMGAGSDVANLSILGYDPAVYYTGRGPLEAASMGVKLDAGEVAFRCNFITEKDGRITDYSAGHITSTETEPLIKFLNENNDFGRFYRGVSYRNLFVTDMGAELITTPPHDVMEGSVSEHLIKPLDDSSAARLNKMILDSKSVLESHPVNKRRAAEGKNPANMIWLWGQGRAPSIKPFHMRYGVKGAVISAVDLIKGIGIYAGMEIVEVPNATGLIDTNWEGKAEAALKALETVDLVYVHVEAIDEAAHAGDLSLKIQAIEEFDRRLVGPLLEGVDFDCKIAVLPDHFTPIALKTHTADPVPFIVSTVGGKGVVGEGEGIKSYSEKEVTSERSLGIMPGHKFMELFLEDSST
ncbi:cofactor-independent phosphoglycerate mutase [archaeon BMS3Bbin16]|nr:cofactor-independent phosphoglycerate mutase [archaeon BMS3Bbin16]